MTLLSRVASQVPVRIALGVGCSLGVAAVIAGLATASPPPPATIPVPVAVPAIAAPTPPPAPAPLPPPPPPAPPVPEVHSNQLMFVFQAGKATYMKLADLKARDEEGEGLPIPRHGKLRHANENYIDAAIATVADRDVPAAQRVWKDRKVKVDNTCEATVVGFALVARVVGDPGYAGMEKWNAASVMEAGHLVLAAKLDRCAGRFARDAALPDIVVPTKLTDKALEKAARSALIASAAARATQRAWNEQKTALGGDPGPWHKDATLTTEVLRHPRTGVTFVSIHGHVAAGCGDAHANVWGLFRVEDGKLVPVQIRDLGDVETIDQLIDVDGDGGFEILGKTWLGYDTLLTRASGEAIDHLSVPFVGCPC